MDHDQFLKELVHQFFPELVELVLPEDAPRIDYAHVEWLEQELFPDPPRGELHRVDVVAKVPTIVGTPPHEHEPAGSLLLIHIELEANMTMAAFDPQMYQYYMVLRQHHQLSVLPVAIFLHSVLDGRGVRRYEERIWNHTPLTFVYNYLSLRGLVADDYRRQANMLGVAWSCMMRLPDEQRVEAALEALETIDHSQLPPNKKHLLMDFVQTYTPLDETQQRNLDELLTDPKRERLMPFRKLWSESVREKARREGEQISVQKMVLARFPNVSPESVQSKLQLLSPEELDQIYLKIITANSLQELGLNIE